jgi:hypothetical protein
MYCARILLSVNSMLKSKDVRKSRNVYVHFIYFFCFVIKELNNIRQNPSFPMFSGGKHSHKITSETLEAETTELL